MDVTRTSGAALARRQPLRPSELLRRLRDPSPPIAGLLIDLCGVLYDDTAWRRWLLKLVQRLGLHTTYTPFFRIWQREYLDRVARRELSYWDAFRLFLRAAGLSNGQIDEVAAAGLARHRQWEAEILPLPGVIHVLTRLNEIGVHLTLLSSAHFGIEEVVSRVERLGLDGHFQAILAAAELGMGSPRPSALEVALQNTGLKACQIGLVARDSLFLAEAGKHGIRRIAVNYDEDAMAEVFIESIDQLLDAVPWEGAHAGDR